MGRWLAIAGISCALACVRVRPHARERLASPSMAQPPWPAIDPHERHVQEVREGTGGATGATGGGCGCN
ncbi:MAG TPA: DUF4266 domain-containing protein, partial [Kofleriaceae bacterium]|jgi:hypothetical protein|nr:DUF4266 domain-containing protein [Kofleriaceae bacterium]